MMTARHQRVLRAAAAASFATLVALLSHLAGGGGMPQAWGVVLPWALSLVIATPLVGVRLSAPRLGAAVAVSQVLFHLLFVVGASGAPGSPTGLGHAAHFGGAAALPALTDVDGVAASAAPAAGMWVMHVVAAAVTTLVLHRAERLMRGLAALAARAARRLGLLIAAAPASSRPPRTSGTFAGSATPLGHRPIGDTARRGPPALLVF